MSEKEVCSLPKNSREIYQFRLGEFKGHRFVVLRIYIAEPAENGGKPQALVPTKKGIAVSPTLWPQFKVALAQVEKAMDG